MEGSVSRKPEIEQNLSQVGDGIIEIFELLKLGNKDHLSIHDSDVHAADGESSKNITNQPPTTQETSDQTSFLNDSVCPKRRESANSVINYDQDMWRYHASGSKGKNSIREVENILSKNNGGGDNISKNLGVGSSSGQGRMDYFHQPPSDIGHVIRIEDIGNSHSYNDTIIVHPFIGIEINELGYNHESHTMNNSWNQKTAPQFNAPQCSNLQIGGQGERGFMCSQETLGNCNQRVWPNTLFSQYRGSFLELMIDKQINFLFEKILDECEGEQLDYLVEEVLWSNTELFLQAAFTKEGSTSICKLIKKIKKTNHAYTLTRLLSTRLYELMTNYTARTVIKQCLDHFRSRPNEALYEKVILCHGSLAIDEVGCRSLNECLSTISGMQKMILLDKIAEIAVFLSNDPYGNYVVQQAMRLGHDLTTAKILSRLRGHFAQLSYEKGGSHVVERCLNSSNLGTSLVVEEILQTPAAAFHLARHQFGNYVIQTALRNLKRRGNETLYSCLVKTLQPHFPELQCNGGGKQVVNLIIGAYVDPLSKLGQSRR